MDKGLRKRTVRGIEVVSREYTIATIITTGLLKRHVSHFHCANTSAGWDGARAELPNNIDLKSFHARGRNQVL